MTISRKKTENTKFEKFFTLLTFFAVFAGVAFAQTSTNTTPPMPTETPVRTPRPPRVYMPVPYPTPRRTTGTNRNTSGIPAEKSIMVDAKANVQLCVTRGNLKVNGWDRNEIRVIVEDGGYAGFKVLNKNAQNEPAVVIILGFDPMKTAGIMSNNCLSGEKIEIDVPRSASIGIKGQSFDSEISSVYKAQINNNSGDITFNDIAQGIDARTNSGNLNVENSSGEIQLSSINGNIFAFNTKPVEFSNIFVAKTNSGAIKLQSVDYPQINTKSTSGTIDFSGNILSGGQYDFYSQNGSILLNIPQQSSCAVTATYLSGNFQTDLTMTNVVKTPGPPQRLTGQIGTGDATLKLNTYNGAIYIRRKEP